MGICKIYIFTLLAFAVKVLFALTIWKNDSIPKRGEGLKISCLTTPVEFLSGQTIVWTYPNKSSATTCFADGHVCTGSTNYYNFTADNNGVYATIYSLERTRDNGTWACNGSDYLGANNTVIDVYTSTKGVKYVQPVPSDGDLGHESITLICETIDCTYPAPYMSWYYMNTELQMAPYNVSAGVMIGNSTRCDQFEAIYTSTLHLTHGTTFQGNIPFRTRFVCGVQHSALHGDIYSETSNYVNFAVNLTSVTLKDMTDNVLPNIVELVQGSVAILKCVTSTSRPTATVRWYIGNTSIISEVENIAKPGGSGLEYIESKLTFTPSNAEHHTKNIFCQAYSSMNSSVIGSIQHILYVKVPNVTLVYDHTSTVVGPKLSVVNGTSITLHCETGPSRPASIIVWYKGNIAVQNGVISRNESNNGFDTVTSSLTFMPSNDDHEMKLFCQGYNIDPRIIVTSAKPILNVTVYVSSITMIPGNSSITFVEGDQTNIRCVASASRPHPQIRWWIDNVNKTDNIMETFSNSGNLIIMQSEITLMLNRSYVNRHLYCDTQVPGQGTWISSFMSKINVWSAPEMSVNVTPPVAEVNSEANISCSAHGEPSNYTFYDWTHKLGSHELRRIKGVLANQSISLVSFPNITVADMGTYICSVENGITGPDGRIVQRVEAEVDVVGVPVAFVREITFIGETNMPASIRVLFFSNPFISDLKFFKTWNNTPIANDTETHVYHTEANVSTVFHNAEIVLQGMAAVLSFSSLKESDFGQYTLVLYNNKGNTTLSVHLNPSEPNTGENVGPSIAGIAGGLGGGVVVIFITGLVIFFWRRHSYTNKAAEDDRDMEFQERERPENGKKHEKFYLSKKNQVDVYENSEQVATNLNDDSGTTSENVPQVNKDRLHYADLNLDPPTLKKGKYVIHGLENRTEYAEIAYGKKGDPLSDSNDKVETNNDTR